MAHFSSPFNDFVSIQFPDFEYISNPLRASISLSVKWGGGITVVKWHWRAEDAHLPTLREACWSSCYPRRLQEVA